MLHQPRLARRSQLLPQAGAWFSDSPLQFSSMRSGELLHAGTGAVAAALYCATSVCGGRASRVCGRASRACGSAMQAETEAGCMESDDKVASAAIIEEK